MAIPVADADTLPQIDVSTLHRDDQAGQRDVANQIARACESTGFFYIVGHDVP